MACAYAELSCDMDTTNYIRLDKDIYPDVYNSTFDFSTGIAKLREGKENIIIATGPMVHAANRIADGSSSDIGVIDIFRIPINEAALLDMIKGAEKLITLEEHFLPGGLGSAVCEILNDNNVGIAVKRLGLDINSAYKHSYKYGGREVIRSCHGIDKDTLEKTITEYFQVNQEIEQVLI
jgi:transketolase